MLVVGEEVLDGAREAQPLFHVRLSVLVLGVDLGDEGAVLVVHVVPHL